MRISDWSSDGCSSDLGQVLLHAFLERGQEVGVLDLVERRRLERQGAGGEQGVLCGGGGHGGLGGRLVGGGGGAGFGSLAIARREGEADGSGKDERSQYGGSPEHGPAGPEAVKGNDGADPLECAIGSVDQIGRESCGGRGCE